MRICVIYDCLYPNTIGGAERWYRNLAEAFAGAGHDVTYLTRRQWETGDEPRIPGVRVIAVSPGGALYDDEGRRLIGPPVRFGLGVLRHLATHRASYDAVHTCAFPFFSLPAVRLALAGRRVAVGVDWFEVWSRDYWSEYLGGARGALGYGIQRVVARITPRAFVFTGLYARRLTEQGFRGEPIRLAGLLPPLPADPAAPSAGAAPTVVFAGRHIPEKRARVLPAAIAEARRSLPGLRGAIYGDGPERPQVLAEIARLGLGDAVTAPGFVDAAVVEAAIGSAVCLVLPSSREGYGLVVVEAASRGTPSVVVAGPDNAATELVEEGRNGFVAASAAPADIAAAIAKAAAGGAELRASTSAWFERRQADFSLAASLERVLAAYGSPATAPAGDA
jgi:glycosyltransferase involved in cell wall biosynthesis